MIILYQAVIIIAFKFRFKNSAHPENVLTQLRYVAPQKFQTKLTGKQIQLMKMYVKTYKRSFQITFHLFFKAR